MQNYKKRRRLFREQMQGQGIAFFFSAPLQERSNGTFFPYRQDSDFFYLTGFGEEESILVLTKEEEYIYLRPRDPKNELWNGPHLGIEKAPEVLGIPNARPKSRFLQDLPCLIEESSHLYYSFGKDKDRDADIFQAARLRINKTRTKPGLAMQISSPCSILHEMRLHKSQEEIQLLEAASAISHAGHMALLEQSRAGMYEYELEAILHYEFHKRKAQQAYSPIIASGPKACIMHYIKNDRELQEKDLVLVDAGAEIDSMCSDVTRTFPVGARFLPIQKEVYEIVLEAQKKAIARVRPGITLEDVHETALLVLIEGLIALKVLQGSAEDHLEQSKKEQSHTTRLEDHTKQASYKDYFVHHTSHWLGMDVHDVGNYYQGEKARPLNESMVFTIEPGLYFPPYDTTIRKELRGIGVRIEDDICVQKKKALVLTESIPKEVKDIEELRKRAFE